jgi:hypothetical protein
MIRSSMICLFFPVLLYYICSVRNLFLGYYLPYRHSVPLWEMENDYYLHNFHVLNARNAITFMKMHERAFSSNYSDKDDEMESHGNDQSNDYPRSAHARLESERIARIRKHCTKQNLVLSTWWKKALQANLKEKNLLRFGATPDSNALPGRFERVYQPEKLTQFDRVFSRTWETPVRRSHAAQHAEGADGDDTRDLARIISVDVFSSNHARLHETSNNLQGLSTRDFIATYGFQPRTLSKLQTFAQFFDGVGTSSLHSETEIQDYGTERTNLPKKYQQYCDPMSSKFHIHSHEKVKEFNRALHDLRLSADDVAGICEVSSI